MAENLPLIYYRPYEREAFAQLMEKIGADISGEKTDAIVRTVGIVRRLYRQTKEGNGMAVKNTEILSNLKEQLKLLGILKEETLSKSKTEIPTFSVTIGNYIDLMPRFLRAVRDNPGEKRDPIAVWAKDIGNQLYRVEGPKGLGRFEIRDPELRYGLAVATYLMCEQEYIMDQVKASKIMSAAELLAYRNIGVDVIRELGEQRKALLAQAEGWETDLPKIYLSVGEDSGPLK